MSCRAAFACRRFRACTVRRCAARVPARPVASTGAISAKEGRAAFAPRLLPRRIGTDSIEERTGNLFDRQRIDDGGNHQPAELSLLLVSERLGLVGERLDRKSVV